MDTTSTETEFVPEVPTTEPTSGKLDVAKEKARQIANEASDKAHELKASAAERAAHLKAIAEERSQHARAVAAERTAQLKQVSNEKIQQSRVKARECHASTEEYIRQHPTKSVLTALGVGFVVGLLIRK
ncbi:DUF883 family protein [Persicirhabdus sediminis]|uniref:DUF883 family protein n=1 Tax=Persicirhabdus sediminis TaxID=454144 RepID=A0A8J7MCV4_9BACT|nr:DUF883 family protein [Persicirhabdus sediminis]MBK1790216.1 DUF883 family protein [Persicirhabdus sediminis]